MQTPTEQTTATPAALTAEQEEINRRLLEAVAPEKFSVLEMHMCIRDPECGGWEDAANWLDEGETPDESDMRFKKFLCYQGILGWEPAPNLFCTTPDAAGYEAAYWREVCRRHIATLPQKAQDKFIAELSKRTKAKDNVVSDSLPSMFAQWAFWLVTANTEVFLPACNAALDALEAADAGQDRTDGEREGE